MFTDFSSLLTAVKNLGIDPRDQILELSHGIEVTSEAQYVAAPHGLYDVLPSGYIARVMLHIGVGEPARCHDDPYRWHRYHLTMCAAYGPPSRQLKSFKTRRTDGRFSYFLYDSWGDEYKPHHREAGRPLMLCGNCRNKLGTVALDDPDGKIDLESLLQGALARRLFPTSFRHDHDRIVGFHPVDWRAIAYYAKERAAWHCTRCGGDYGRARKFLHAHFVETPRIPEAIGRVTILCAGCHAREPGHSHLLPAIPEFRRCFPDHSSFVS